MVGVGVGVARCKRVQGFAPRVFGPPTQPLAGPLQAARSPTDPVPLCRGQQGASIEAAPEPPSFACGQHVLERAG